MTSSLRAMSLKMPWVTSLYWMRISVFCSLSAFPARMMNGTPSHRGELMCITAHANVGETLSLGTVSSSLYPGLSPVAAYCPMMMSFGSIGGIYRSTLTCTGDAQSAWHPSIAPSRTHLLVADVLGAEGDGPLHRQDREDLQQIYDRAYTRDEKVKGS